MKLLSPVHSLSSAKLQIESGADEIYTGLKTDIYQRYSFSGRGQTSKNYSSAAPDLNELYEIVSYAHTNHVDVSLAANVSMFADRNDGKFEEIYVNYIREAIKTKVDNIIVGDIGLLYRLSRLDLPVNLHASTYFDTHNIEQLKFLKSLNVTRAVLTYQSSLEEIQLLCNSKIMEIEVLGYLCCSFYNGSCNLIHDMGEVSPDGCDLIGVPCKAVYEVKNHSIEKECDYLNADLPCGLCAVQKLIQYGTDIIKIAGRDRNMETISQVTKLFRTAIDMSDTNPALYKQSLSDRVPDWWKWLFCKKDRCKYEDNNITRSYIGI